MSEVKQFHLREGTLIEGKSLGCLNVYLASDYDQLKAELDRLRDVQILLNTERALVEQLEERLDEARELLAVASEIIHEQAIHIDRPMTDLGSEALTRLDDWLEENKI